MSNDIKKISAFLAIVALPFVIATALMRLGIVNSMRSDTTAGTIFGLIVVATVIGASVGMKVFSPSPPKAKTLSSHPLQRLADRVFIPNEDIDPRAIAFVRSWSRGFFDLLRNLAIIGVIQYFSEKTGNRYLGYLAQGATYVLTLWLSSYLFPWHIRSLQLRWARTGIVVEIFLMLIFFLVVPLGLVFAMDLIIEGIAAGYLPLK